MLCKEVIKVPLCFSRYPANGFGFFPSCPRRTGISPSPLYRYYYSSRCHMYQTVEFRKLARCPFLQAPPQLEAPTNLRVRKDNDTAVTVFWDFNEPESIPVNHLNFTLVLKGEGKPTRTFYRWAEAKPLQHPFTGLSPGTEYSVEIWATLANWEQSLSSRTSFVTMETGRFLRVASLCDKGHTLSCE